jgi:hypothetical protein
MKTPIQELIENLDTFLGQGMSYNDWKELKYDEGKTSIARYLEKEKEVIMDAWQDGRFDWGTKNNSSEQYYNETFNTKEK